MSAMRFTRYPAIRLSSRIVKLVVICIGINCVVIMLVVITRVVIPYVADATPQRRRAIRSD